MKSENGLQEKKALPCALTDSSVSHRLITETFFLEGFAETVYRKISN